MVGLSFYILFLDDVSISLASINILNINSNWISGNVQSLKSDLNFIIINIYGPISNARKKTIVERYRIFYE